jgi:uncharacterized protein (DUF1800 family)
MRGRQSLAALLSLAMAIGAGPAKTAASGSFGKKIDEDKRILHALNRLTFGPRAEDLEQVRKTGLDKWIDNQLHPERVTESRELEARLQPLESIRLATSELTRKYPSPQLIVAYATGRLAMPEDPATRALIERLSLRYKQRIEKKNGAAEIADDALPRRPGRGSLANAPVEKRRDVLLSVAPQQVIAHDLQEAKLYRAIYSNRQLAEVLADFWFNHFNVYLDKGADRFLVTSYERDAIRPYVLGNFRDMLVATAQHPAMLWYLDNWQSVSPDASQQRRTGKKRSRGLNENYARELLELHTLGVDGGYTQKDIVEVARCFTGWTIREPYRSAEFHFNERVHDKGEKTVLGVKIAAGGGHEDGLKVIDILMKHPSTARFVSTKLARAFIADDPPDSVINAMAQTFRKTNGDVRQVMRTMLKSREFWSEGAYRAKVKSPLELVASAVRVTGAEVTFPFGLAAKIGEMGQPLYRKQEPTGYSNTAAEWVNSAGLLGRMNFALALMQNELPGIRVPEPQGQPGKIASRLLFNEPGEQIREVLQRAAAEAKSPQVMAALVIGSPEFQRR